MLPAFLRQLDFVSIGTNDLIQYTLAIDRADEAVAHLYDPLHPAVLQLVAQTIARRAAAGKDVERLRRDGGRPGVHRLLLGMGLRSFSMHPSQIVDDQAAHAATDTGRWRAVARAALEREDPRRRRPASCDAAAAMATCLEEASAATAIELDCLRSWRKLC